MTEMMLELDCKRRLLDLNFHKSRTTPPLDLSVAVGLPFWILKTFISFCSTKVVFQCLVLNSFYVPLKYIIIYQPLFRSFCGLKARRKLLSAFRILVVFFVYNVVLEW